jgi:hypothetical protein
MWWWASSNHALCILLAALSNLPLPSLMEEVSKQRGGHLGILRQHDGQTLKHSHELLMFSRVTTLDAATHANK